MAEETISIFYSWQSDLLKETNHAGIRAALRKAASDVEDETPDIKVDIDEATRKTVGSIDIAATILYKIKLCDIFVCDITTINKGVPDEFRKVPNPNVLLELGYAVAQIGWDRIIMLFNSAFGNFPDDMPFDLARRRAMVYSAENKSQLKDLNNKVSHAIREIIKANPSKPSSKLSPEKLKRNRDIYNLRWLMSSVHLSTMDVFIYHLPDKIIGRIFHFWEGFQATFHNSHFHLYDKKAEVLISAFHKDWAFVLSFGHRFGPSGDGENYNFGNPIRGFSDEGESKDHKKIMNGRTKLETSLKELLKYLRENYLEIDLEETSKNAFADYKEYYEDFLKKISK